MSSIEREDEGFFGPDSVTWRVWSHPSALVAGARATAIQMYEPLGAAGVAAHSVLTTDFSGRLARTAHYFAIVAFGDSASALAASEQLMRIHAHVKGTDSITGKPYRGNAPETQLWVHLTSWHSALYCYERFGPGKLSDAEVEQYWSECRTAAYLQTFDPDLVPQTREGVRAYFEEMRPRLCMSEHSLGLIAGILAPALTRETVVLWPIVRFFKIAALTTMPRHLKDLAGLSQPRFVDAVVAALGRPLFAVFDAIPNPHIVIRPLLPGAADVLGAAIYGPPAKNPRTVTPDEARNQRERQSSAS